MNKHEKTKSEQPTNGAIRNLEKSGMHFSKEQWEAQDREMEEDAKKPLSQRRFLSITLGTVAMDEHFFHEDLEKALIHSNPYLFVQLRERSCRISTREIPYFDPVAYLHDAVEQVANYVKNRETEGAFQRLLFKNTTTIIIRGLNDLISQYSVATSSIDNRESGLGVSHEKNEGSTLNYLEAGPSHEECKQCEEITSNLSELSYDESQVKSQANLEIELNDDFLGMFNNRFEAEACIGLLKRFGLIGSDGLSCLGRRDKAHLLAYVEALQQVHLLPVASTTAKLTSIFAKQIGLDYKRPRADQRKRFDGYTQIYLKRLRYISMTKLTWSMVVDDGR